jgi:sigma-B regulation protein RsbU (phosphoserine phosphatase)
MRVLIAEDDPVARRLLQKTLEGWGYQVVVAEDGLEAWRLFQENEFSLVVSDWMMPAMDGEELVRRIRGCGRPGYVFIILLTAKSQRREVLEGMAAGADDCVVKPFDPDELRARLRAAERIIRLEEQLLQRNRILSERNAQMEADLRMAREVQQALLPQRYPTFPAGARPQESALGFCDRYLPNGEVGGDFFDVLPLSDTQAGVFIGDVMGHGVRSALVTAMVRALLEGFRNLEADPAWCLEQMNRGLLAMLGQPGVPVFLTAFYMVLDVTTGEMRYANAGHPCPLHVRPKAGEVVKLPAPGRALGPPLGVREQPGYEVGTAIVQPGELVILFTDGIVEETDANQEMFGEQSLLQAIQQRIATPPGRMFDELLAEVHQFSGAKDFADDVCLLSVELVALGKAKVQ